MINDFMKGWRAIYCTYKEKGINKLTYYYLLLCLFVLFGLIIYLYWEGCVGIMILFNAINGTPTGMSFNILKAIGLVLVVRYALLSGIDAVAKRTPDNITERLTLIEDRLNALHRLAFGEDEDDADELRKKEIEKRKGGKDAKAK